MSDATKPPAAAGPPARPAGKRKLRWVLIGVPLVLAAGEIGARILADTNSQFNIHVGGLKEFDPELKVRLKPNYDDGKFLKINTRGFLGPEFEAKKAPGGFRVVTLGDSCSFIPQRRNYPRVLEELLRKAFPDRPIEVINASCPGYAAEQGRRWYERDVDGYEHDLLIVYLGWNDMGQYNPDGLDYKLHDTGYLPEPNFVQKMLINCYLLRTFYVVRDYAAQWTSVSQEPLSEEDEARYRNFYPEHFEGHLRAIIALARRSGRKVLLLNYATLISDSPTEDELARLHFPRGMGKSLPKYRLLLSAYRKALDKVARDTDCPIVDIASLFDTPEARQAFTDTAHYNVAGAERIAAKVFKAVRPLVD